MCFLMCFCSFTIRTAGWRIKARKASMDSRLTGAWTKYKEQTSESIVLHLLYVQLPIPMTQLGYWTPKARHWK